MAGERSNAGENSKDGFDFQQFTLLFCADHLTKHEDRFEDFEIGSGIPGYGAFDDVVIKVTPKNDPHVQYHLLQVKHSNQRIHENYLFYNDKTYVIKYFETFLDLIRRAKNPIPLDQVGKLCIWTNMPFAGEVKKWFEDYDPIKDKTQDILEGLQLNKVQSFRFRENLFKDVAYLCHTRMKLVYEIVEAICSGKPWDPKSAAKSYYLEMAKEIFEGNGPDIKFKQDFINGNQGQLGERDRFRMCFKKAMERKFIREKIKPDFSMDELNSDEYRKYFNLNVDTNVPVCWKGWPNEEADLEEFRKRFVFYVNVPGVKKLETVLQRKVKHFSETSELLKRCAFTKMINKKQYKSLTSLVNLRQCMDVGPYTKLTFDDSVDPLSKVVEQFLPDTISGNFLHIKAPQDVDCTISRLISPVMDALAPQNDRYLILNWDNFDTRYSDLEMILQDECLTTHGLVCLIIAKVPSNKLQDIEAKLSLSKIKAILVGEQLDNCFVDEFDISMLHPSCKNEINNRVIYLSEQFDMNGNESTPSSAGEIYGNELFKKENSLLALHLFQHKQPIEFDGNKLQLDKYFRARMMKVNQQRLSMENVLKAYRQIIISDQAGMGKSTELINIAIEMRKTYKDHLVIYLDLKDALRHYDVGKDIGYSICKMIKVIEDKERNIRKNVREELKKQIVLKIIDLGKFILLLDGLDEVSNNCSTKMANMLNTISRANLFKLVIASRPHCSALKMEIFHAYTKCELEPFSASDQLEYLLNFWEINQLPDENDRIRIRDNAQELIKKFRSMLKDDSLIGIPLQTYMIAFIYKTSILSKDFEQPKPYKIGYIYERFVDLKLKEVINRQFDPNIRAHENLIDDLNERFVPDHITLAHKIYVNAPEPRLSDQLQTYGLVRLHPTVAFVHYTYLEYFLSLYFFTHATNNNVAFKSFMSQNLCVSRESIATKFMDFHIDAIDPRKKLETNDTGINRFEDNYQPPSTARLHPDKLREFHHYLSNCKETERYTLIRNSFNLSVFNVFEVLYDSLPKDTKTELKFCFGNKPEPYYINLKLLGGNQMLQLLNILLKKNPENFVQLYLTAFEDDEEDFLEVTCRKPFVQVLDWLVDNLIPYLNEQEMKALKNYVNRRFGKYFQLIVQHNNAQLLEQCIERAKNLWPETTINSFLLQHNVLLMFLNTVELRCNTKVLKEEQRVEMIRHVVDLYEWAFDGQLPAISDVCRNIIASLTNDAIKRAFDDAFPGL